MCTVIEITTTFMRNKNISSSQIFSSRECGDCGVMEYDTGPESSWHHLLFQQSELSSNSWNSLFSISKLTGEFHDTFIHRPHKHDSLTGFIKLLHLLHTSPQERSSHEKLYKTSEIIFHGYLPSRTLPVVSRKCRMGKICTIAKILGEIG